MITSVIIKDERSPLILSVIYCPPKHNNKKEDYEELFQTLGNKFIVGGDFNTKYPIWGSPLATTKRRELVKAMDANNLKHISTNQQNSSETNQQQKNKPKFKGKV